MRDSLACKDGRKVELQFFSIWRVSITITLLEMDRLHRITSSVKISCANHFSLDLKKHPNLKYVRFCTRAPRIRKCFHLRQNCDDVTPNRSALLIFNDSLKEFPYAQCLKYNKHYPNNYQFSLSIFFLMLPSYKISREQHIWGIQLSFRNRSDCLIWQYNNVFHYVVNNVLKIHKTSHINR